MKILRIIIGLVLILKSISIYAQDGPPPPAMPTVQNEKLIDSLVEVSGFKKYFSTYCKTIIDSAAVKQNWTQAKINIQKAKINFIDFKNFTIYNAFAFLKTDELITLINLFSSINKEKYSPLFISSSMIMNNLQLYAKRYIE